MGTPRRQNVILQHPKPTPPPSVCSHAEAWARRCTVLKHTTLQRCVGRAHPSGWEHHNGRTLSFCTHKPTTPPSVCSHAEAWARRCTVLKHTTLQRCVGRAHPSGWEHHDGRPLSFSTHKPTTPPSVCSHAEAWARRCTVLKHTTLQRCVGRAHPSGWEHHDGRTLSLCSDKSATPPSVCSHAASWARRCTVLKHTTLQRCVGRAHPSGWDHRDGRPLSFSTHTPTTPPSVCSHAEAWARRCTVLKHTTLQRCVGRAHPSGWEHHDGRTLSSAPTNRPLRPRFVPTLKRGFGTALC